MRKALHGQLDLHPRTAVPEDVEGRERQVAAAQEETATAEARYQVYT